MEEKKIIYRTWATVMLLINKNAIWGLSWKKIQIKLSGE